ncbi:SRPBCC family protein [Sphaerisporangium sp. TRM90804]|uniref:SRPBCC family protein n=1 Tax=Sphaerisporangium sp. TRM90804 TaxID=3031113 RepID=UPI002448E965|nr:SRPBCC family protein [Sphaerisporangium sp. TRM90804]MDH2428172.1 SRPBCC family protein [Sphaerisporangium sp. TRM90804]
MSTIEHSVDVAVPIRTAYNQWTQFESFPEFMEGVESIKQLDDTRLVWNVQVAGVHREFEAEITEQKPDERVAWRSLDEPRQGGVVTFHHLTDDTTRVMLQMEFTPEGLVETVGDKLQLVRMRVHGDLERFKKFIESQGHETGGWRGEVPAPHDSGDYPDSTSAARREPDASVLQGTGTGAGTPVVPGSPGAPAGAGTAYGEPAAPVGTGAAYGEPEPPRPVADYPRETPLPAPGSGPVSPLGTPRLDDEPPLKPERLA